jgi:Flp pilus assembly protein TadG
MMRWPSHAVVLPDIPLTGSTTVAFAKKGRLRRRRALHGDEGATAVEFALVLPVFLAVVFFALYGSMYFFYGAVADHVARSVVREVAVPDSSGQYVSTNAASIKSDAKSAAGSLLPDPQCAVSTVNAQAPATDSATECPSPSSTSIHPGDLVTVTVIYHLPLFNQLAGFIPGMSAVGQLSRSASDRAQ